MSFQPVDPAPRHRRLALPRAHPGDAAGGVREGRRAPREIAYFEEKIAAVTTAADLVADRRLLKVALGAFGLEGEIDKKAFIRKVLEEGTTDRGRLADPADRPGLAQARRRLRLRRRRRRAHRRGRASPPAIVAAYKTRAFEAAVGEADNDMRLAMNFRREIADARRAARAAAGTRCSARSRCAQVFEKAFGLPTPVRRRSTSTSRPTMLRDRADGCSARTR